MGIRRQHYVPQGFLKGFAVPDRRTDKFIWVYQKLTGRRPRRLSIKSVAWEPHYYEQETEAGASDTDSLEKKLATTIDNVAPVVIRSINAKPGSVVCLSAEDQGALAFFIGLALTRVPGVREPLRELHTRIAQGALGNIVRRDLEAKSLVEQYCVSAEAKSWVSLQGMVRLAQLISQSALQKYWQFFVPPEGASLVTSDNPVIFGVGAEYGPVPAGPAHPLAELVVNLRRDLGLVCTPRRGGEQYAVYQMSTEEATKFNRGIVRAARRFVFAAVQSADIDQLTKEYIGQQQTIEIR